MKNIVKLFGVIALVAVIGFSMAACPSPTGGSRGGSSGGTTGGGSSGNTDPKTLIITMPTTIGDQAANTFSVGLFPTGTTLQQASNRTGLIAGSDDTAPMNYRQSGSNYIVTLPLYNITGGTRWTGSGTFDIYGVAGTSNYYKAGSVRISSANTNITITASNAVH